MKYDSIYKMLKIHNIYIRFMIMENVLTKQIAD